jgi:hypothetical protein
MRILPVALCGVLMGGLLPARGDHQPVLVAPGRPEAPVMIDGFNAAWGAVEGDWGLYRPGAPPLMVIPVPSVVTPGSRGTGYFPSAGHEPRYGRKEVEPPANRALPPPAQSYHRSWGAASDPAPATIPQDPPIILAPPYGYRNDNGHHP